MTFVTCFKGLLVKCAIFWGVMPCILNLCHTRWHYILEESTVHNLCSDWLKSNKDPLFILYHDFFPAFILLVGRASVLLIQYLCYHAITLMCLLNSKPSWFSWSSIMYSKANLKSRGTETSLCFRLYWKATASDKYSSLQTLLELSFTHILISLFSFMSMCCLPELQSLILQACCVPYADALYVLLLLQRIIVTSHTLLCANVPLYFDSQVLWNHKFLLD